MPEPATPNVPAAQQSLGRSWSGTCETCPKETTLQENAEICNDHLLKRTWNQPALALHASNITNLICLRKFRQSACAKELQILNGS